MLVKRGYGVLRDGIPALNFLPRILGEHKRKEVKGCEGREEGLKEVISERVGDVMRVLIVGGGIGGIYTALNLIREGINPRGITVVADEWPPYSRHRLPEALKCGYLGGLELGVAKELTDAGVNVVSPARVASVDPASREVTIQYIGKGEEEVSYDCLVVATGGKPFIPPIPGTGLRGVTTFYGLNDVKRLLSLRGGSAVVVGGGLVGVAAAISLRRRGLRVALIELKRSLLPQVIDPPLSEPLRKYLTGVEGIKLFLGSRVKKLLGSGRVTAVLTDSGAVSADAVVFATGVRPNSELLLRVGASNVRGAITVDGWGRTSLAGVYALGDCALSKDYITGRATYRPLGFVAAHYAKYVAKAIAGAASGEGTPGVIPTIYERLGEVRVYRLGLSASEARSLGLSDAELEVIRSGDNVWEARVLAKGRIVGWELVTVGHEHVIPTATYLKQLLSPKS